MSILFYTQHVLGMGHLFRSLAVAQALGPETVHLITGGAEAPAALPPHVRHLPLPPLMMDADFSQLHLGDGSEHDPARREELVAARFMERTTRLRHAFADLAPDLLLVELYPFGRKRFGQEIQPLLEDARNAGVPVVCSLRDILVEKKDQDAYERRVLEMLHRHFSGLLVHSDPTLFPLDATFERAADIAIPLAYSGYVAPDPVPEAARHDWRASAGLSPEESLVLASIGGGAVGLDLMRCILEASYVLRTTRPHRLLAFAGPFMAEAEFRTLQQLAAGAPWMTLERFTPHFQEWLAVADCSVSLAGYNTVMGVLAQGTPALVLPFDQNREQRLRATALAGRGLLELLHPAELEPAHLAARLDACLHERQHVHTRTAPREVPIDLNGAAASARILRGWREAWRC